MTVIFSSSSKLFISGHSGSNDILYINNNNFIEKSQPFAMLSPKRIEGGWVRA